MAAVSFNHLDQTMSKLKSLKDIISGGESTIQQVAEDTGEESSVKNELYQCMLNYAKMRRELNDLQKSVEKAKTSYLKDKASGKDVNIFEQFSTNMEELENKHNDEDLQKMKSVELFNRTILSQSDSQSQENVDDEEIVMTQVDDTQFICPITKADFVDPVKNTLCGHTYSKEAIECHIRNKKGKAKCPKAGCSSSVSQDVIVEDNITAFELRKKKKNRK